MVDWSDDCRRWLCGRGRRPNIYAAITTLLLIVIAVQRRESTDDSSTLDTTDRRRRHAASPVMDTSRDLKVTDQQLQPVVGLFLLVDLDNMHEEQWNQTLHGSPSQVHTCTHIQNRLTDIRYIYFDYQPVSPCPQGS